MSLNREEPDAIKARDRGSLRVPPCRRCHRAACICDFRAMNASWLDLAAQAIRDRRQLLAHVADLQQRLHAVRGMINLFESSSHNLLMTAEERQTNATVAERFRGCLGSASPEPPESTWVHEDDGSHCLTPGLGIVSGACLCGGKYEYRRISRERTAEVASPEPTGGEG